MEYDEAHELVRYVWNNYLSLMTDFERRVGSAITGHMKAAASNSKNLKRLLNERWGHVGDPEVDAALADGGVAYQQQVASGVLSKHHGEIFINRCPGCRRVVRTPTAQHCFWCGSDWHYQSG